MQQYMNPQTGTNYQAFPRYQTPLYQDRFGQVPNTYQPPIQYNQMPPIQQVQPSPQIQYLSGQMVDSIESVRAKDVDMSGAPTWYPNTDGSEIYRKQLQADGRSQIFTYKLVQEEQPSESVQQTQMSMDVFNNMFQQFKQEVLEEISGIKDLVAERNTAPEPARQTSQRGGSSK